MKLLEIKELITNEIETDFPNWNTIKHLANQAFAIEDSEGYGYEDEGMLYSITCSKCNAKWLIPHLETYQCEKCNHIITILY